VLPSDGSWACILVHVSCACVCRYSTQLASYAAPIVSAVTSVGGRPSNALSTLGGDLIEVRGRNFGPLGLVPSIIGVTSYSIAAALSRTPVSCDLTEAHVAIRCSTIAGYGRLVPPPEP
jgi:hypothetical protein